jgi:hypothetical protein
MEPKGAYIRQLFFRCQNETKRFKSLVYIVVDYFASLANVVSMKTRRNYRELITITSDDGFHDKLLLLLLPMLPG